MEDFRNENVQLNIKINELTNKLVELANEVIKLEKENKELKEDYTKAYMMNLDFFRIYDIHNTEKLLMTRTKTKNKKERTFIY